MSDSSASPLIVVFALVYLSGSVCISGGPCMTQWASKRGYKKLALVGMVVFTCGGLLWNIGAMNMPALLVAPLLTSVLIMNVVFAKYVNKEAPSKYDLYGSGCLAVYMLLLVIGQPGDSEFHRRFVTKTGTVTFDDQDACLDHEAKLEWILEDVVVTWQLLTYLLACALSICVLVGLNWHIRFYLGTRDGEGSTFISGIDVDNYRLTFSCIGGVFGGSEDIFILFLNPMFASAFEGCTSVFFSRWLLYVDLVIVVLWFVFQMWWVSRGVVVAGAKLNGSLELISHQFSTLFGIQIGLQGYKSFDENMFGLPVPAAVGIFSLAIVFGVVGSAILMHGYSVFRRPKKVYTISNQGSLHSIPSGLPSGSEGLAAAIGASSAEKRDDNQPSNNDEAFSKEEVVDSKKVADRQSASEMW